MAGAGEGSDAAYERALETLFAGARHKLEASLARRFPRLPAVRLEEAVQEAFVDAWHAERRAWFVQGFGRDGAEGLYRCLFTAAWRRARGDVRRVEHQRTERWDGADPGAEQEGPEQGEDRAHLGELEAWMAEQVGDAAERFGRARRTTLRRALDSLVANGHAVAPLAKRYALPRRYVAEASVHLRRALERRAKK